MQRMIWEERGVERRGGMGGCRSIEQGVLGVEDGKAKVESGTVEHFMRLGG